MTTVKISKWRLPDTSVNRDRVLIKYLRDYRRERQQNLDTITHDLIDFAIAQGYTNGQLQGALETFYETFSAQLLVYIQIGGTALQTAVTNDATIAWLDLDASGQTLRTRLVGRL